MNGDKEECKYSTNHTSDFITSRNVRGSGVHGPLTEQSQWRQAISGNVFVFGVVSFLNDLATEMMYPLLPVFFSGFMASASVALYIGLMEGLSESVASLLKFYSGRLSDRLAQRKPLTLAGYAISSFIRPFTAIAFAGWQVVVFRLCDRIGKGIRTSPRDALLSASVVSDIRGRAFSFHRLMDHAGAVAGPLLAAAFLYMMLGNTLLWQRGMEVGAREMVAGAREMAALRWLFALVAIPGIAASVTLWRLVKEPPRQVSRGAESQNVPKSPHSKIPGPFILFLVSVVLFTLGNSSDLFLIFYAQNKFGLGLGWVIALWILLHLSKVAFSLPGGWLADKAGRRVAITMGWLIYAVVYLSIPLLADFGAVCALLLLYGVYYGMTEGAERALVADFVDAGDRGRAYGLYHSAVGFATLPASLMFGVFWAKFGPKPAFLVGALLAIAAILILWIQKVTSNPLKC